MSLHFKPIGKFSDIPKIMSRTQADYPDYGIYYPFH